MSAAQKSEQQQTAVAAPAGPSLVSKFAAKFGVEPNKMLATLKATAFKGEVSNEQMMALLIVSDQFGLNPWTKEIYAFPDKNNGIVPVVGVDGWSRIINSNAAFDGMEFATAEDGSWIECKIWRKDRQHPTAVTEYLSECKRSTAPWSSHPRRMLRHKAMIQCARVAFGYVGIYDEDEAERIIDGQAHVVLEDSPKIAAFNEKIKGATVDGDAKRLDEQQEAALGQVAGDGKGAATAQSGQTQKGPTAAEVGDRIVKAKTLDELQEARALIAGFDDKTDADLRAEADRAAARLGTKPLL